MKEITNNKRINLNYGQSAFDDTKGGEHGARVLPLSERTEKVLYELKSQKVVSEHVCCNLAREPIDGNKFNKT